MLKVICPKCSSESVCFVSDSDEELFVCEDCEHKFDREQAIIEGDF